MFGYTIYLRVVVVLLLTNLRRPGGCAEKARTRVTFSRIIETDVISAGWSHTECFCESLVFGTSICSPLIAQQHRRRIKMAKKNVISKRAVQIGFRLYLCCSTSIEEE